MRLIKDKQIVIGHTANKEGSPFKYTCDHSLSTCIWTSLNFGFLIKKLGIDILPTYDSDFEYGI